MLKFKKTLSSAFAPYRGSEKAAGLDLRSALTYLIPPRKRVLINVGLKIELPAGTYGRIAPRSGLALKHGLDIGGGVIDQDFRGELKVLIFNHSNEAFEVRIGDRIAQLICEKIIYPEIEEEEENLSQTDRGSAGFGSTGVGMFPEFQDVEMYHPEDML